MSKIVVRLTLVLSFLGCNNYNYLKLDSLLTLKESKQVQQNSYGWNEIHYKYNIPGLVQRDTVLLINRIYCADKTFLNNNLIGQTGYTEKGITNLYDKQRAYFIPKSYILTKHNELRIESACPIDQLRHGPIDKYFHYIKFEDYSNFQLHTHLPTMALAFISITFGLVFFSIFKYFPRYQESFYLGILCFAFSGYALFTSQFKFLIDLDSLTLKKIEYVILFSFPYLFIRILVEIYTFSFRTPLQFILLSFGAFSFMTLFSKDLPAMNLVLRAWHIHLPIIFVIILVIHTLAISKRNQIALEVLAGSSVLFCFGILDIMGIWGLHRLPPMFHYGGIIFLAILGFTISKKIRLIANHMSNRLLFSLKNVNKQKKELQQEANWISKTIANISHDIKTPLSLISIPLEMLRLDQKNLSEKQTKIVERVWKNFSNVSENIDNLLSFSKNNETGIALTLQKVQIIPFLEAWLNDLRVLLEESEWHLYEKTISYNAVVNIDPDKLRKVLNNLVTNSIVHAQGGNQVFLHFSKQENQLNLRIWDNGVKIQNTNIQNNRFAKFETTAIKGTGLGLYLSKIFCEEMDILFRFNDSFKRNCFELIFKIDHAQMSSSAAGKEL